MIHLESSNAPRIDIKQSDSTDIILSKLSQFISMQYGTPPQVEIKSILTSAVNHINRQSSTLKTQEIEIFNLINDAKEKSYITNQIDEIIKLLYDPRNSKISLHDLSVFFLDKTIMTNILAELNIVYIGLPIRKPFKNWAVKTNLIEKTDTPIPTQTKNLMDFLRFIYIEKYIALAALLSARTDMLTKKADEFIHSASVPDKNHYMYHIGIAAHNYLKSFD